MKKDERPQYQFPGKRPGSVRFVNPPPAKQGPKDECTPHKLIMRFLDQGALPRSSKVPMSGDFVGMPDLQGAYDLYNRVGQIMGKLGPAAQKLTLGDFLTYVSTPQGYKDMVHALQPDLGRDKVPVPTPTPTTSTSPTPTPSPEPSPAPKNPPTSTT